MKESELGSKVASVLRKMGWTVFKLKGDIMQRGLPDYVMWKDNENPILVEFKRAKTMGAAIAGLSPGQESVLVSLARSAQGAQLAWGDEDSCGLAVVTGDWKAFKEHVGQSAETMKFRTPTSSKRDTFRSLAELLDDNYKGAYIWDNGPTIQMNRE